MSHLRKEIDALDRMRGAGDSKWPGDYGKSGRFRTTPAFTRKLTQELNRVVRGAGVVIHVEGYEEAKGGGWIGVFDTEYAALKAHYAYRGSPGLKFGRSPTYGGWYVSVK